MDEIKKYLGGKLKEYVALITEEYQEYLQPDDIEFLQSITDFSKFIEITDTKTISLYVKNRKIYFPLLAFSLLESFKKYPNYGSNPNHKCYNQTNLIVNDNTFYDYINHVIISGMDALRYFEESFLHESMHFCGSSGGDPIREGLTELNTRKLAQKKGLITSGCGYPKEISIALRLQELFGEKTMNEIAFAREDKQISEILITEHGPKAKELYFSVRDKMLQSFLEYYNESYDGPSAPLDKAASYSKIDYTEAHELITAYGELEGMITSSPKKKNQKETSNGIKN